jgi:hypothetical protein
MLELGVKFSTEGTIDRLSEMAAEFIERADSFAAPRGIPTVELVSLQNQINALVQAYRLHSRIRIRMARNGSLHAIARVRDGSALFPSLICEANLPPWLRP